MYKKHKIRLNCYYYLVAINPHMKNSSLRRSFSKVKGKSIEYNSEVCVCIFICIINGLVNV